MKRKLKKQGYIKLVDHRYIPDYDKLQDSDFNEIRQKMIEKHERLISEIISYARSKYKIEIEARETEKAFETFIDSYQFSLLETNFRKTPLLEMQSSEMDIIISSYVIDCESSGSLSFEYLIDIVKGTMLTNALYYNPKLNTLDMEFKGTEVYFDSSFLIYALGFSGYARQEPCSELLNMLRDSKAILRVFRHNIEEIVGILEWCKNNLTTSTSDHHGTISHFITNGYNTNDIDRIIDALENEIEEKLKIMIVETTGFDEYKYIISESELEQTLQAHINYPRKNALERDIQSVSAIARLRKDIKSTHVESCRAVFITTNPSLAQTVRNFFYNEEMPRAISPVLHDSTITNLVWLKNPSKAPELPSKRLIAECYAATAPKEHLWKRYIETLNIFEKTSKISQKDIVLLRYTPGAREFLVEKTIGDENAITIGTVQEILDEIKLKQDYELKKLEKEKEDEILHLRNTLFQTQKEIAATEVNRTKKIKKTAKKRAKIVTITITISFSILVGIALYSVPIIQDLQIPNALKIIILVLLTIGPTILGLLNISFIPVLKKLNEFFLNKFEEDLKNKYY
jgi:hypothetical protein